MTKSRVVATSQVDKSLIAKNAHLYRQGSVGNREHTEDLLVRKEVDKIFG